MGRAHSSKGEASRRAFPLAEREESGQNAAMQKLARGDAAEDVRRRALLDAALTLFARKGYEASTVKVIASSAGLSPAAFYRHFPTKAEIHRSLVLEAVERLEAGFTAALSAASSDSTPASDWPVLGARRARARLEALAGAYLRFFDEHRELYLVAEACHLGPREGGRPRPRGHARRNDRYRMSDTSAVSGDS